MITFVTWPAMDTKQRSLKPGYQCLVRDFLAPKTFRQWVAEEGNVYIGSNLARYLKDPSAEDVWGHRELDRDLFYNKIGPNEYKILYEEFVRQERWELLDSLAGKVLGCWCPRLENCHASVLMKLFHEKLLENRLRDSEGETSIGFDENMSQLIDAKVIQKIKPSTPTKAVKKTFLNYYS